MKPVAHFGRRREEGRREERERSAVKPWGRSVERRSRNSYI
jgi:hypothetical protein